MGLVRTFYEVTAVLRLKQPFEVIAGSRFFLFSRRYSERRVARALPQKNITGRSNGPKSGCRKINKEKRVGVTRYGQACLSSGLGSYVSELQN